MQPCKDNNGILRLEPEREGAEVDAPAPSRSR